MGVILFLHGNVFKLESPGERKSLPGRSSSIRSSSLAYIDLDCILASYYVYRCDLVHLTFDLYLSLKLSVVRS